MTVSPSPPPPPATCAAAAAAAAAADCAGQLHKRRWAAGAGAEGPAADGLGPAWMFWRRRRYVLALLAFLGFAVSMVMRVNMGLAIVDMTSNRTVQGPNGTLTVVGPEFAWDSREMGAVLSAFFYGYAASTLPGGWLAARWGGALVLGLGLAGTAALTLATPALASAAGAGAGGGWAAWAGLRAAVGLCEGVSWPAAHALWARWAPPLERARLANLALTGLSLGPVLGMSACGALAQALGWRAAFYATGAAGAAWVAAWAALARDSPDADRRCSPQERRFIRAALAAGGASASAPCRRPPTPWRRLLLSPPVWAVAVAHFCEGWGYTTFLTQLPIFLRDALGFELAASGLLAALPYVAMVLGLPAVSVLADRLVASRRLSVTHARKAFNCAAFLAQTVFLLLTTLARSPAAVVACMTLAQGIGAFACCGFSVNPLDLAPQFASLIMGLSCAVSTLSGMLSPLLTGFIVTDQKPEQWRVVFYVASGVYLFGAVFYLAFASGERQPWAMDEGDDATCAGATAAAGVEEAVPLKAPCDALPAPVP